jgi:hypothetical protein
MSKGLHKIGFTDIDRNRKNGRGIVLVERKCSLHAIEVFDANREIICRATVFKSSFDAEYGRSTRCWKRQIHFLERLPSRENQSFRFIPLCRAGIECGWPWKPVVVLLSVELYSSPLTATTTSPGGDPLSLYMPESFVFSWRTGELSSSPRRPLMNTWTGTPANGFPAEFSTTPSIVPLGQT